MPEGEKSIADLNDQLRTTFQGGDVHFTHSVATSREDVKTEILQAVTSFSGFTEDNDPYGEHNLGVFKVAGESYMWKIDYYSKDNPNMGSENPGDPEVTRRVMTIMQAGER